MKIAERISLSLAACLPLLVPFEAYRNIELQGLILIIAGVFAWLSLALRPKSILRRLPKTVTVLLIIFAVACMLSALVNPHKLYDLIGSPYIRLGTLGLLACIGCGLLCRDIDSVKIIQWLYGGVVFVGLLSLIYSLAIFQSLDRLVGVFAQADIMAVFLGAGVLLGLYLLQTYPHRRRFLTSCQLVLVLLLLLTQTRAVIAITTVLALLWQYQNQRPKFMSRWLIYLAILILSPLMLSILAPGRLTNLSNAGDGLHYRLVLQEQATKETFKKPLLGYGPGNLGDALNCHELTAPELHKTCSDGYFFNSSHNIFIDRILAIGWLGGLSFAAFVVLALHRGLKGTIEIKALTYVGLLIAAYYLTNVTSVVLELLFWVVLLKAFSRASA